ncbi:MAG: diguanylate cyclase, partial [Pseudomonadota bacterium]
MSMLQELLGTSLPDTLLIIDRRGKVVDACLGTDTAFFDVHPKAHDVAQLWPADTAEAVNREVRKVLKSRRPQSAVLSFPTADGNSAQCEVRFRAHGRESVLVVLRTGESLASETTGASLDGPSADLDPETGLRSRRWLSLRAADSFNEARLREESVAIVVVEFPELDTVNVSFGRTVAVRILQSAADRIGARIRRRREQGERDEIALLARDAHERVPHAAVQRAARFRLHAQAAAHHVQRV